MKKIFLFLLSLLFPKTCSVCGENIGFLRQNSVCERCIGTLESNTGLICHKCSLPLDDGGAHCRDCKRSENIYFDRLVAPYIYKGNIQKLIHKLKYNRSVFLAYDLSKAVSDLIKREGISDGIDVVTEVPMHFLKKFKRGYNQAFLIAEHISETINKPLIADIVKRKRYTKALASLNRRERIKNLGNVFCINKKYKDNIKNKTVLLVDDVATSCTTANLCAGILKKNGAKKVFVAAVARAHE